MHFWWQWPWQLGWKDWRWDAIKWSKWKSQLSKTASLWDPLGNHFPPHNFFYPGKYAHGNAGIHMYHNTFRSNILNGWKVQIMTSDWNYNKWSNRGKFLKKLRCCVGGWVIHPGKEQTLEISALETPNGGQFTLSTQFITSNYLEIIIGEESSSLFVWLLQGKLNDWDWCRIIGPSFLTPKPRINYRRWFWREMCKQLTLASVLEI